MTIEKTPAEVIIKLLPLELEAVQKCFQIAPNDNMALSVIAIFILDQIKKIE